MKQLEEVMQSARDAVKHTTVSSQRFINISTSAQTQPSLPEYCSILGQEANEVGASHILREYGDDMKSIPLVQNVLLLVVLLLKGLQVIPYFRSAGQGG